MKISSLMAGIALSLSAVVVSPTAYAGNLEFSDAQQGSGACQPAREYPDLRMRQKEVDNIGTTNAYVVCSPMVHFNGGVVTGIVYQFLNTGDVNRVIRCTLQNDYLGSSNEISNVVREIELPPGEEGYIEFGGDDFNNPDVQLPGTQCILPGSTSLGYTAVYYVEADSGPELL